MNKIMRYYSNRTDKGKVYKGERLMFSMEKTKGLAGKLRNITAGALVGIAALTAGANKANATIMPINSFKDFINDNYSNTIRMDTDWATYVDNLMIRDSEGVDSIVNGTYHAGFIKYEGSDAIVTGWADNKSHAWNQYPEAAGFLTGDLYSTTGDGQRPEDIWLVHDGNNDGIGNYDTSTGQWSLGVDDIFYTSQDILFGENQIRGDISQLPAYSALGGIGIIPSMTIDPVPEPSTIALLGLGAGAVHAGRKRRFAESKEVKKK
jgi:hypothetical protein